MTGKGKTKAEQRENQRTRQQKMGIDKYATDALTTNRHVIESPEFKYLNGNAAKALFCLIAQYNGYNNGNLSAPLTQSVERFGLGDKALQRALKELESAGFIEKTRQGGRNHCSLYAVTFYAMDAIKGLDIKPTAYPSNKWRKSTQKLNETLAAGKQQTVKNN